MVAVWILGGLACGLLVNYLADVLPRTRRLSKPLWLPISSTVIRKYLATPRVISILLLSSGAALLLHQFPPSDFPILLMAAILGYFLLVAVIDMEHRVVLHPVSLAGAIGLGFIGLWRHGLASTLIGGLAGFGLMLALYFAGEGLGRLLARLRGGAWNDIALGFGDVNLAGVIGLLMGWPGIIVALFSGMLAAGLFSGAYILWMMLARKYRPFTSIPYAPFLCFGAVLMITLSQVLSSGS